MATDSGPILIVDDNQLDVLLVMKSLIKLDLGRKIDHASNGLEAQDYLQSGKTPSLIFLDINMPGMDGLEFLRLRLANADWYRIPVVMLSASSSDQQAAMELGASGYMVKPSDFNETTDSLRKIVESWHLTTPEKESH